MPVWRQNWPLCECSTFHIGGDARCYVEVTTLHELTQTLRSCSLQKLPFHILGKGSNSLFDDRGFDGLMIHIKIAYLRIEQTRVVVGGGYSFARLGVQTARKGLSGLEFASGIPGSVGGAIFMNAGAFGRQTADALHSVLFVDERGDMRRLARGEMTFAYRSSPFTHMRGAIAEATFDLIPDQGARRRQLEMVGYRSQTQPYRERSGGCVFTNCKVVPTGALIERCGLKGARIGGAEVSALHANFIVNRTEATASDVIHLAQHVQTCVKEETGIDLKMELQVIPFQR